MQQEQPVIRPLDISEAQHLLNALMRGAEADAAQWAANAGADIETAEARESEASAETPASDEEREREAGMRLADELRYSSTVDAGVQTEVKAQRLKAHLAAGTLQDAADWLGTPDEADDPLVEGLIENGEVVALVGQAKSGKSLLALQLAVCVATGLPFLGRACARRRTFVANLEVSGRQYKKRLRRICAAMNIPTETLRGWLFVDNLRGGTATWDDVLASCQHFGCSVALIDPFYQIGRIVETDEQQCLDAVERMKEFTRAGVTLAVCFHSPKGYAADRQLIDMISGSSILARYPESVIGLLTHASDANCRVVDAVLRNYPAPEPFAVSLASGVLELAPDVSAEVKGGGRYAPRKSAAERDAEKVKQLNSQTEGMTAAAIAFVNGRNELPNSTQVKTELERKYPRPAVESFLRSVKDKAVPGLVSVRELWRNPKSGAISEKPSRSGGKVFIATPEKAKVYADAAATLPLG